MKVIRKFIVILCNFSVGLNILFKIKVLIKVITAKLDIWIILSFNFAKNNANLVAT